MNKLIALLLVILLVSCHRHPYVTRKIKFEKVGDDCGAIKSYFWLNSNFGGERYEFEKCLPADVKEDQVITERKGDTVVVKFQPAAPGKPSAVFHVTLDIDSYPAYKFISVDSFVSSLSTN